MAAEMCRAHHGLGTWLTFLQYFFHFCGTICPNIAAKTAIDNMLLESTRHSNRDLQEYTGTVCHLPLPLTFATLFLLYNYQMIWSEALMFALLVPS